MVTIRMGGTAYVMQKFDAAGALHMIERYRISHSQWVPTMFIRLLKLPAAERARYDLSCMRMAVHAAAPCPVEVKLRMLGWCGEIIHEYYSGAENNGGTAVTPQEWRAHPGSVGRAKLGVIHICDETGTELPAGKEGEVYFENGHRFTYHNDPEKTAACTNDRGWTTLGDIGRLDKGGYLYLTDRKSFVIISGGVNIYPQETEDVLLGHPLVLDAAVIGVPSEAFGEEVKAVVQLVPGQAGSEALAQELIAHCRARLSSLECPRSVDFHDHLPRSATGKLYKRALMDRYRRSLRWRALRSFAFTRLLAGVLAPMAHDGLLRAWDEARLGRRHRPGQPVAGVNRAFAIGLDGVAPRWLTPEGENDRANPA